MLEYTSPVPAFGRFRDALVATVGINPSNLEFMDFSGLELVHQNRRLHTLASLGLNSFSQATSVHAAAILDYCETYFVRNPYHLWFKRTDSILSGLSVSYYDVLDRPHRATHLDIVQSCTRIKWTALSTKQRQLLITMESPYLGRLLARIPTQLLILNGATVVRTFQEASGKTLQAIPMPEWDLQGGKVRGVAYSGTINCFNTVALGRDIRVLGYNHNIQSSFGVTREVIQAIRDWVAEEGKGIVC